MNQKVNRLFSIAIALVLALGVSLQALGVSALDGALQPQSAPLQAGITYYVSTTGKDTNTGTSSAPFRTFAKAVSVLKPGDTLQVTLEAKFGQESMGVHRGATAILGPAGQAVGVGYRSAVLP